MHPDIKIQVSCDKKQSTLDSSSSILHPLTEVYTISLLPDDFINMNLSITVTNFVNTSKLFQNVGNMDMQIYMYALSSSRIPVYGFANTGK